MQPRLLCLFGSLLTASLLFVHHGTAITEIPQVELQPLAAQVKRLIETLDYLGAPLSNADKQGLERATTQTDAANASRQIQDILDKHCLYEIHINPESRVKVTQAKAKPELVENGWRTFLIKVHNEAGVTAELKAESTNALRVYVRSKGSPNPEQTIKPSDVRDRWLDLSLYTKPPLKPQLSGLNLEYKIIQLYSRDVGKREAKVSFNVGQGSQDIGRLSQRCRHSIHVFAFDRSDLQRSG